MHEMVATQPPKKALLQRAVRRFLQGLLFAGAIAVTLIVVMLLAMWREHRSPIALPAPTGHFAAGRTTFDWTNLQAAGEWGPGPNLQRQLIVWVWYPASHSNADICRRL
ncbi:MAG TPA: hypothetical protein VF133_00910 [Terriglobales bacterium]